MPTGAKEKVSNSPKKKFKPQGGVVDLKAIKDGIDGDLYSVLDHGKEVPFVVNRKSAHHGKRGLVLALYNSGLSDGTMAQVLFQGEKEVATLRVCAMVHPEGLNMLHHLQNISGMSFAYGAGQFKS